MEFEAIHVILIFLNCPYLTQHVKQPVLKMLVPLNFELFWIWYIWTRWTVYFLNVISLVSCWFCITPWSLSRCLQVDVLLCRCKWQIHPFLANLNRQVLKAFLYLRIIRMAINDKKKSSYLHRCQNKWYFFGDGMCLSNMAFDHSPSLTYKELSTVVT